MNTIAVDFETFFDRKRKISLTSMSPEQYLEHPEVHVYLVAMVGDDFEYCGDVENAPWDKLKGAAFVAHNARWDYACLRSLLEKGQGAEPAKVFCTADMAAYLWGIRALAPAYEYAFGEKVSKQYRTTAEGRTGEELKADKEAWVEIVEAGIIDARTCKRLWDEHNHLWPDDEKEISEINREGQMLGVYIDMELAERNMEICKAIMVEVEQRIPWADEWRECGKHKTPLAAVYVKAYANKMGVVLPKSLDKKNPEFIKWKAESNLDWVWAMEEWNEAHRLLNIHETELSMTMKDGVMPFNLKYFGAIATGRFSGGREEDE